MFRNRPRVSADNRETAFKVELLFTYPRWDVTMFIGLVLCVEVIRYLPLKLSTTAQYNDMSAAKNNEKSYLKKPKAVCIHRYS
ncbi:hypothetical protein DVA76_19460, partial [Acinetobacter baumannii]